MSSHSAILPRQLQISFLQASSRLYESVCPNIGRSLISKVHDSSSKKEGPRQHCIHCHSPLQPGLCRVKLSPRAHITSEIEHLRKKLDFLREGSLSPSQKKKLKRWMNSKNIMVICCSFCKKTNRIPCAQRSDRPQQIQASQNTSPQDSMSRKRKKRSVSNDPFSKLAISSTGRSFLSPPSKKQKRESSSSNFSVTISQSITTPGRSAHGEANPSPSGRSSRSAKKDKYRQLQTMLKSAKREQENNQSPLSKFLTSLRHQ
ncbi:UPF0711 protein C18orf21 homolog isoform X2 [Lytechinus pictus]|uniref:UPF0711 protein C18orf21 homolog isoform X2 n=1 Tax=Lytechinus pictus TaxID=7653 RepID=UPI0030B9F46B